MSVSEKLTERMSPIEVGAMRRVGILLLTPKPSLLRVTIGGTITSGDKDSIYVANSKSYLMVALIGFIPIVTITH